MKMMHEKFDHPRFLEISCKYCNTYESFTKCLISAITMSACHICFCDLNVIWTEILVKFEN